MDTRVKRVLAACVLPVALLIAAYGSDRGDRNSGGFQDANTTAPVDGALLPAEN